MLFAWAALVGVGGAGAALLFKAVQQAAQWTLAGSPGDLVEVFSALPWWRRLLVPTLGGALAGATLMLAQRFVRRKETDYMEAVSLGDGSLPLRPSLVRSTAAMLSIASGAAIGREGPLVQLAAATGSLAGRLQRMSPARRRILVACGAAAGVAAAYHTALGGALFVAEVVLGSLAMESLWPLLIASVTSALTVQSVEGFEPLYRYSDFMVGSVWEFGLFIPLGVLCGMGSAAWMRVLRAGKRWFGGIPGPTWLRLTLGGLVVGSLALWRPEVTGNGTSVIQHFLGSHYAWRLVLLLVTLRVMATVAAFGSGAVGGVFTPSLLAGAGLGFLFAAAAASVWPEGGIDPGGFALIGMGSFLASAAQAPVTTIVMMFEFTMQYEIVPPLMLAVVASYFTARALGSEGLYAESLRAGPRGVFDRRLASVTAGDLMQPHPSGLPLDAPLRDIARRFLRSPVREVWVANQDGSLAGGVFLDDVAASFRDPNLAGTVILWDVLRADAPVLRRGEGVTTALERFTRVEHDTLPVVDEDGRLVGTVARSDLLLAISELALREGTRGA